LARHPPRPAARRVRDPLRPSAHPGADGSGGLRLARLLAGPRPAPRRLDDPGAQARLGTRFSNRRFLPRSGAAPRLKEAVVMADPNVPDIERTVVEGPAIVRREDIRDRRAGSSVGWWAAA